MSSFRRNWLIFSFLGYLYGLHSFLLLWWFFSGWTPWSLWFWASIRLKQAGRDYNLGVPWGYPSCVKRVGWHTAKTAEAEGLWVLRWRVGDYQKRDYPNDKAGILSKTGATPATERITYYNLCQSTYFNSSVRTKNIFKKSNQFDTISPCRPCPSLFHSFYEALWTVSMHC